MPTIHPWSTPADLRHGVNALRGLLSEVEREPIDRFALAEAWDGFRGSFGKPGIPPAGVSVDGDGVPDYFGVTELVTRSVSVLNKPERDDLLEIIDCYANTVIHRLASLASSPPKSAVQRREVLQPVRDFLKRLRSVIEHLSEKGATTEPRKVADNRSGGKPSRVAKKQRTETLILSALNKHHEYESGSCLNYEPVKSNQLARSLKIAAGSVSRFFGLHFEGHKQYVAICARGEIGGCLKLMNGDLSPKHLYGTKVPTRKMNRKPDE